MTDQHSAATASDTDSTYTLGHSEPEIARLLRQARIYDPLTENALRAAGVSTGMRVLDAGCGPGDVSFVAAALVGPTGAVHGVDASADAVTLARSRAHERGYRNVSFTQSGLGDLHFDEPFDAVIGRLILMHLPDPAAMVRQLATLLRPGGIICFCENDMTAVHSVPPIPAFADVGAAILRSFEELGMPTDFGNNLHTVFEKAGLGTPRLSSGTPIGTAADSELLAYAIDVWRLVLPVATQLGLAEGELADPDAMLPELRRQMAEANAVFTMPPLISAWCHR